MNRLLAAILVLFSSCTNAGRNKNLLQPSPDTQLRNVLLVDSLGTVTVAIPLRYDTSFEWINWSDCGKPCAHQEYRFQDKKNPITKESGWFWTDPKDSVDQFTISHSSYIPFRESDTSRERMLLTHAHVKEYIRDELQYPPIIFDTVERINDRYFSIVAMERSDTILEKRVLAVSYIKHNEIWFEYTLKTGKRDSTSRDFIRNSLELIKWIKIQKGP